MAFIARKKLTDRSEDVIDANDVTDTSRDYYCPHCNCVFRYKAEASNKRAAHFFRLGEHQANCLMPDADLISGRIDRNIAKNTDFYDLYQIIINTKDKVRSKSMPVKHHTRNASTTLHLNTVRNLYKFCCYVPDTEYIGSVQVKDIFVARKTKYLYTSYIQGIKLIEAKFYRYDPINNVLFFYYPCDAKSSYKATFRIHVKIENNDLFNKKRSVLFDSKTNDKKSLILAECHTYDSDVYAEVSNTHQIVLL